MDHLRIMRATSFTPNRSASAQRTRDALKAAKARGEHLKLLSAEGERSLGARASARLRQIVAGGGLSPWCWSRAPAALALKERQLATIAVPAVS